MINSCSYEIIYLNIFFSFDLILYQIIFSQPVYRNHTYVKLKIMQKSSIWRQLDQ